MLQNLGHTVFPLGIYFGFTPVEPFRPALEFGETEHDLLKLFRSTGCRYHYGLSVDQQHLEQDFIDRFDAVIVMHSIDFIQRHWDVISRRPVVWRTIGVNIEAEEYRIAPFRALGCKIVRYSPMESLADSYAGHDAIIRFGKSPDDFREWQGSAEQVVVFSNQIKSRFPAEYLAVAETLHDFNHKLCGVGNDDIPNSAGIVPYETQLDLLMLSRAYLYGVGTFISYTLNFMEAWISGIPLVVLDGRSVLPAAQFKFAEVPSLIVNGRNGFLISSPNEARAVIRALFADREMAARIGQAGRADATALFGMPKIAAQWSELLSTLSR